MSGRHAAYQGRESGTSALGTDCVPLGDSADDDVTRNWRREITDPSYLGKLTKVPRAQRAVFFGTPRWKRHQREK